MALNSFILLMSNFNFHVLVEELASRQGSSHIMDIKEDPKKGSVSTIVLF